MRMTKAIREYIADEITAKYQPYIDALAKKHNLDADDKAINAIKKEVEEAAKQMFTEKLAPYYEPDDLKALMDDYSIYRPKRWGVDYLNHKQYCKEKEKLTAAREAAIRETIVTMDLGGTKEQLDEMLAKINPAEAV